MTIKKRIAIVFDFDETLVQESTTAFIENLGINPELFWKETVEKLMQRGWDPVPAYLYCLIEFSNKSNTKITKQTLQNFAKYIVYKQGVLELFDNLRNELNDTNNLLEFYVVSSGIGEIIKNSEIAKNFKKIWASDFEYNTKAEIIFAKNVLSFTDKTRYIFQISKGMIDKSYDTKPYAVNEKIDKSEYRIPISQMIYIGDGMTDVPCFSLIKRFGGTTIAVYDAQNSNTFGKAWEFIKDERVNNLHSANYTKGSDLYNSLVMAIKEINNKDQI